MKSSMLYVAYCMLAWIVSKAERNFRGLPELMHIASFIRKSTCQCHWTYTEYGDCYYCDMAAISALNNFKEKNNNTENLEVGL